MPTARMPMRRAHEILRLKYKAGLATREIVRRTGVARRTVRTLLDRLKGRGLTWPLAADLSEAQLQELLFHDAGPKAGVRRRPHGRAGRTRSLKSTAPANFVDKHRPADCPNPFPCRGLEQSSACLRRPFLQSESPCRIYRNALGADRLRGCTRDCVFRPLRHAIPK